MGTCVVSDTLRPLAPELKIQLKSLQKEWKAARTPASSHAYS